MKINYYLMLLMSIVIVSNLYSGDGGNPCTYFVDSTWNDENTPPEYVVFNNDVYYLNGEGTNAFSSIYDAVQYAINYGDCDTSLLVIVNYTSTGTNVIMGSGVSIQLQGDYTNSGSNTFTGTGTIHVSGDFYFEDGHPGILYLGNAGLQVDGHFHNYGPTNYIVTNGAGSLTFTTHSDVTAPVGTDDGMFPVDINAQPGQVFAVRVDKEPDFPGGIVAPGVQDSIHWLVENLSGATNCTVKFIYPISMVVSGFSIENAIVNHYNNGLGQWETLSSTTNIWSENSNYYISTVTGINNFSPFAIGINVGIPILTMWYKIGLGVLLALFGIMMLRKMEIV